MLLETGNGTSLQALVEASRPRDRCSCSINCNKAASLLCGGYCMIIIWIGRSTRSTGYVA
jgi:hypothetical protein